MPLAKEIRSYKRSTEGVGIPVHKLAVRFNCGISICCIVHVNIFRLHIFISIVILSSNLLIKDNSIIKTLEMGTDGVHFRGCNTVAKSKDCDHSFLLQMQAQK